MRTIFLIFLSITVLGASVHAGIEQKRSGDDCISEVSMQCSDHSNEEHPHEHHGSEEAHHCSLSHIPFYVSSNYVGLISIKPLSKVSFGQISHYSSEYLKGIFRPPKQFS